MTNFRKDLIIAKTNLNNYLEEEYILDCNTTIYDLKSYHLYEYRAVRSNDTEVHNYILFDYDIRSNDNEHINHSIIAQIFDLYYDMYNQDVYCAEIEQIF
jgi:hypothetical protein